MTYNKIPLALSFDGTTGNASGLVEFTLNLSDAGDVCTDVTPTQGQSLVWSGDCYAPSTVSAAGGGTSLPAGGPSDVLAYVGGEWSAKSYFELGLAETSAVAATYATTVAMNAAFAASALSAAATYQPLNDNLDDIAAISTLARGDILYVNSSGELVVLSLPTESGGFVLKINPAGDDILWGSP